MCVNICIYIHKVSVECLDCRILNCRCSDSGNSIALLWSNYIWHGKHSTVIIVRIIWCIPELQEDADDICGHRKLILWKTVSSMEKLSYFQTTYGTDENRHARSEVQSAEQRAAKCHSPYKAGSVRKSVKEGSLHIPALAREGSCTIPSKTHIQFTVNTFHSSLHSRGNATLSSHFILYSLFSFACKWPAYYINYIYSKH